MHSREREREGETRERERRDVTERERWSMRSLRKVGEFAIRAERREERREEEKAGDN